MRKLMIAAGAAALLASASLAMAAEATGAIAAIDTSGGTVTLDSGQTFSLPQGADLAAWKVGDKVKITYEESGGQMQATTLEKAAM